VANLRNALITADLTEHFANGIIRRAKIVLLH
jgi:hypothetical protein